MEGAVTDIEALDLRGLPSVDLPTSGQAHAFDGGRVTAGFAQYDRGSHFVIYEREHAAQLYTTFLSTAGDPASWSGPVLTVDPDQRR